MIDVGSLMQKKVNINEKAFVSISEGDNQTLLIKAKEKIAEHFGDLKQETNYHYATAGRWSQHELLQFVLSQTGPSKVYLTAWKVNETTSRSLFMMVKSGLITELHVILDRRMTIKAPEALDLIKRNVVSFHMIDCHAKIFVVENDIWTVSSCGSANLTINPRIEAGVLTTVKSVGDFHIDWIKKQIDGKAPLGR